MVSSALSEMALPGAPQCTDVAVCGVECSTMGGVDATSGCCYGSAAFTRAASTVPRAVFSTRGTDGPTWAVLA